MRITLLTTFVFFLMVGLAFSADKTIVLKDAFIDGGCMPQDKQCGFMTDKGEIAGFFKSSKAGKQIMPIVKKCNDNPIQPRFNMTIVVDSKFMIKELKEMSCTHKK